MFLDLGRPMDGGLISTIDLTIEFDLVINFLMLNNKKQFLQLEFIFFFEVCGFCVV
jgi:hypothetical protein